MFGWIVAAVAVTCHGQLPSAGEAAAPLRENPLSPAAAHEAFQLAEDSWCVELVAAEPLVESPVAAAFLSPSRLLVVENRGYPTGPPPGEPPQGRISLLSDDDGDGQFDRRTTFADELTFPNGVLPYNDGVLVTCAPDILFLADRDGDGRAEVRRVLLTGFSTAGSTQLRVSHPLYGHDGWVYVCGGLTGGNIRRPDQPENEALAVGRADVRFRETPSGVEFERCDGGGQFGQSFDDFGRRFICYNRVQVQHVVLSSVVLQRNKHLAFAETVQNCPAEMQAEPLAGHGAAARLFPISQNVTTADSHAGTFTAACGVTVFRGHGLGERFRRRGATCVFSCDPTANVVHWDELQPQGATFSASAPLEDREFLASADHWFRPVNLFHGPDGALYICDMYRRTIEHPDYLPEEIRKHTDFESGKNLGRIWRVVLRKRPKERPAAPEYKLPQWRDEPATADLIYWLRHGDGWWQDEATRRLAMQRDDQTLRALEEFFRDELRSAPAARALWLLERHGAARDDLLRIALSHKSWSVRETALAVLLERRQRSPLLEVDVLGCATDAAPRVRFLSAIYLTPGESVLSPRQVLDGLAQIAVRSGSDRWTRAAVLSSIAGHERGFLEALLANPQAREEVGGLGQDAGALLQELGELLGAQIEPQVWTELAERVCLAQPPVRRHWQAALLVGVWNGLRQRGHLEVIAQRSRKSRAMDDPLDAALQRVLASQLEVVRNPGADVTARTRAAAFLSHTSFDQAAEPLLALLDSQTPAELQSAAVDALAALRDERSAAALLSAERFSALSPVVCQRVLQALLADNRYAVEVLSALERGVVPAGVVDAVRRRQLLEHGDAEIRQRAAQLFAAAGGANRQQVYKQWKSVDDMISSATNGREVFRRACAQCHRLDREGFAVGPDLFGIRNQPKAAILLHVLIPNREITPGFAAYTAHTQDGRTLSGLLVAETESSVTLRQPQGKEEALLRSNLERLEASGLSLMPEGFETQVSRQEMADLLAYLKGET